MESKNVKESIKKYLGISQREWSSGDEDGENLYERPPRLASELQSRPGPSRIGRDTRSPVMQPFLSNRPRTYRPYNNQPIELTLRHDEDGENVQGENLDERPPRLASELQSSDTQGPSRIGRDTRSPVMQPFFSNRPRTYRPYNNQPIELTLRHDEDGENVQGENLDERPPRLASELQSSDTQGPSRIGRDTRSPLMANPFLSNRPRRFRPYNYQPIETLRLLGNIFRAPAESLESPITLRPNPGNQNPGLSFQSRDPGRESPRSLLASFVEETRMELGMQRGEESNGMPMTGEIEESDDVIVIDETQHEEARTATSRPNVEELPGDSVPRKKSVKLPCKHGNSQDNGISTARIANGDSGTSTGIITNGENGTSTERISNGDNGNSTENDDKEPTEKELNQDLLHLLECPVCMECMEPPLAQCRRGHLVCCSCRLQLNVCPICRTTFSSTRNRAMEGVAELVRYPCRHECGKRMRLRRRLSHEASCEARRYSCPMHQCSVLQAPVPLEELVQHIKSIHNASIKIGEEQRLLITTACRKNEWMLLAHHELFQLRTRIHQGHFDLYVAYIGPKSNSTRYIYKVTVQGKCNARQVTYLRYTHSDQESCQQTLARQDCFHLSVEQVVNMQRDRDGQGSAPGMLDLRLRLIDTSSQDTTDS